MNNSAAYKLIKAGSKYQGLFSISLVFMFLSGLVSILPPWLVKVAIDGLSAIEQNLARFEILPTKFKGFAASIEGLPDLSLATDNLHITLPVLIISAYIFDAMFKFLYLYNVRKVGLYVVKDLREKFHDHINRLSLGKQAEYDSGSLVARITSDLHNLQSSVSESLTNLFNDGSKALFLIGWLIILDWKLTLICAFLIPTFAFPVAKIGKQIKITAKKGQDFIGGITTFVTETLLNQRVIKAYNLEKKRQDDFIVESDELFKENKKFFYFISVLSPLTHLAGAFGIATILFFGLNAVQAGSLSIGEFSSFFVTCVLIYDPLKRIGRVFATIQSAIGISERVFEVLEEETQEYEASQGSNKQMISGSIEFKSINYSYLDKHGNQRVNLFEDLNLQVDAKTSIAFVGPSGSGKTTLVSLIPRFFEIDSGMISLDEINIRDFDLKTLRKQIALVTQDALLFTGTIKENIMLGNEDASEAEIIEAAKNAHVLEFANEMEQGLDTHIGERGQALSVGQRQRVSLARAFLSNAPIMILDEPTSALDNESESYIQDSISKLAQDRTMLIIAHRLSTIKNCDRIVYIQDGNILESGTHSELVNQDGAYKKLLQEV